MRNTSSKLAWITAKSCLKNKAEWSLQGTRIPVDSEAPNYLLCYEALRLLKKGEGMRNGKQGEERVRRKRDREIRTTTSFLGSRSE